MCCRNLSGFLVIPVYSKVFEVLAIAQAYLHTLHVSGNPIEFTVGLLSNFLDVCCDSHVYSLLYPLLFLYTLIHGTSCTVIQTAIHTTYTLILSDPPPTCYLQGDGLGLYSPCSLANYIYRLHLIRCKLDRK